MKTSIITDINQLCIWVAAWCGGNASISINKATLHRARLVPGWVTVCRQVNHVGM